jgi:hypothetical protein
VCEALVDAKDHGSFAHFDPDRDHLPEKAHLLECPRCGAPMLAGTELYGTDQNENELWSDPYRIFPPRQRSLSVLVPPRIRSSFEEGDRCFKARAYVATAIMCRKTLEGVCDDHGIKSNTLATAIRQLHEANIIDDRLFEWSDALRLTGNAAAHGVGTSLSREDAQDVLEFTEGIVEYLYVLRKRFDDFKKRHSDTE